MIVNSLSGAVERLKLAAPGPTRTSEDLRGRHLCEWHDDPQQPVGTSRTGHSPSKALTAANVRSADQLEKFGEIVSHSSNGAVWIYAVKCHHGPWQGTR